VGLLKKCGLHLAVFCSPSSVVPRPSLSIIGSQLLTDGCDVFGSCSAAAADNAYAERMYFFRSRGEIFGRNPVNRFSINQFRLAGIRLGENSDS
jgi:hypothetical protein